MHNIFTVWRSIKMQSLSQTKIILWLRKCIHISPLTRLVIPILFSFLDSLVHFDSCSQSNPPSKVDALYHNFYGNSWIISELDCLTHKMDSSWKPFSSWCTTYTWNTSLMRLNSWRSCIYCDCQPMSLHHFYLGFSRVFPSINIITTILLLLLRRYPLRYYNKCGVDDHRRLCKWIGMTMDQ